MRKTPAKYGHMFKISGGGINDRNSQGRSGAAYFVLILPFKANGAFAIVFTIEVLQPLAAQRRRMADRA